MGIYVKSMEMPTTGLYIVSVDNTGGRDKTVVTVERMLGNRDVRQIVGSFELVHVPPHGDLVDRKVAFDYWLCAAYDFCWSPTDENFKKALDATPTIIPADEPKEE